MGTLLSSMHRERSNSHDKKGAESNGLCDLIRESRDCGLIASVVPPSAALLRFNEASPPKHPHVMRDRGLGKLDGFLDVARAQAGLVPRDQVATGPATSLEQRKDPHARWICQRLEDISQYPLTHTSKT